MTTVEGSPEIASRLERLDSILDFVRDEVVRPGEHSGRLDEAVRAVDEELADLRAIANRIDDDFAPLVSAVAIRADRFGYLQLQMAERQRLNSVRPQITESSAPPPEEVKSPPGLRDVSTENGLGVAGRTLSIIGLVLIAFLVFQLTGTALLQSRNQSLLLDDFKASLTTSAAGGSSAGGEASSAEGWDVASLGGDESPAKETFEPAPETPGRGSPVALLQIPKLDLSEVVVQGTSSAEMRKGPGHLRGTPMPGEIGNVAIAGARLGNGAPFRELDRLRVGDKISATTPVGTFTYTVQSLKRVKSGEPDPVRATGNGNLLTLVTSAPAFISTERLVVSSELTSAPVATRFKSVSPDSAETGLDRTPGGIGAIVGWGAVLAVAIAAARRAYRRLPKNLAYLLSTPVLLAVLLLVFESIAALLPPTF